MTPSFSKLLMDSLKKIMFSYEAKFSQLGLGGCTIKTLQIRNLRILQYTSMFVQTSMFATDYRKDTSLLRNLSICYKLRIRNVLQYRTLVSQQKNSQQQFNFQNSGGQSIHPYFHSIYFFNTCENQTTRQLFAHSCIECAVSVTLEGSSFARKYQTRVEEALGNKDTGLQ